MVLRHPPVVRDPGEGALYDPAPRQHPEAPRRQEVLPAHLSSLFRPPQPRPLEEHLLGGGFRRVAHHLRRPAEVLLDPIATLVLTAVASVQPHMPHARELGLCPLQEVFDAVMVRYLGAVDPRPQHETFRVHEQVAFPASDLLAPVVPALLPAHRGGLGGLRVHDAGAGLGAPTELLPELASHRPVRPLPGAVYPPCPEIVEHRLPRREVPRQHPPLTAALEDVEDGVQDFTRAVKPRSPALFRGRKMRLQQVPLVVGKVARVSPARHATERSQGPTSFSDGLWKGNSRNFALTAFSEVELPLSRFLGSSSRYVQYFENAPRPAPLHDA